MSGNGVVLIVDDDDRCRRTARLEGARSNATARSVPAVT